MRKSLIVAAIVAALTGLVSSVRAMHTDWIKIFWEEQERDNP